MPEQVNGHSDAGPRCWVERVRRTGKSPEFATLARGLTTNFPWGSLLAGFLNHESPLLEGVSRLARPGILLEGTLLKLRLNGAALAEAGGTLTAGMPHITGYHVAR